MNPRRIRITHLLVILSVLATAGAAFLVLGALTGAFPNEVTVAQRRAFSTVLGAFVLIGIGSALIAWLVGRTITRALSATRATVLARAGGTANGHLPEPWLHEVVELNRAVERLSSVVSRREAELEQEDAQRRVLLDALSEGILQLDTAGRVVRANAAARSMFGLVEQQSAQPFSTQIRSAELRRILNEAAAGRALPATELPLDDRRLLVSVRPLPGPGDGGVVGAVVAAVDLTELRRLEGVRRDFVANVSHELKTPLTSIRGYIETLLTDDLPADMRGHFLEVVRKNADRLQRIVDDLLDLSRLQSGGWRPNLHAINANDVIDDVWSTCRDRAEQRGIHFTPPREQITVLADAGGLRQILSNLLDNALRYTPAGGRIEVAATASAPGVAAGTSNGHASMTERDASYITFEVRDTGSGIPSDALSRVFERFYRVDPARSRAEGGTGLGLSIVKHLVESMGGDVSADSILGKGTTIRFRLPAPG